MRMSLGKKMGGDENRLETVNGFLSAQSSVHGGGGGVLQSYEWPMGRQEQQQVNNAHIDIHESSSLSKTAKRGKTARKASGGASTTSKTKKDKSVNAVGSAVKSVPRATKAGNKSTGSAVAHAAITASVLSNGRVVLPRSEPTGHVTPTALQHQPSQATDVKQTTVRAPLDADDADTGLTTPIWSL